MTDMIDVWQVDFFMSFADEEVARVYAKKRGEYGMNLNVEKRKAIIQDDKLYLLERTPTDFVTQNECIELKTLLEKDTSLLGIIKKFIWK